MSQEDSNSIIDVRARVAFRKAMVELQDDRVLNSLTLAWGEQSYTDTSRYVGDRDCDPFAVLCYGERL